MIDVMRSILAILCSKKRIKKYEKKEEEETYKKMQKEKRNRSRKGLKKRINKL